MPPPVCVTGFRLYFLCKNPTTTTNTYAVTQDQSHSHAHGLCLHPCRFSLRFINRKGALSIMIFVQLQPLLCNQDFLLWFSHFTLTRGISALISYHSFAIDYLSTIDHNLNTGSLILARLQPAVLTQCHGQCAASNGSPAFCPVSWKERGIDMLALPQFSHLGKCSLIDREWDRWSPAALGED